jgi:hypothetical protein
MNTYSAHLPAAPTVSLTEREAAFAEHMAVFDDPAAAWQASGEVRSTTRLSWQRAAYGYLARPHVRARITELRNAMAERGPQATRAALVADLQEAIGVDLREIVSLTVAHCRDCYSSPAYVDGWAVRCAKSIDATGQPLPTPLKVGEFDPDRPPSHTCGTCRGAGEPVVHFTPFDQLSAPAKRLLRGVEMNANGGIKKILLADQSALRMELHKTVPNFYAPTTSINLNINTPQPLKRGMTVEEALQVMQTLAPTATGEPAADANVVSDQ